MSRDDASAGAWPEVGVPATPASADALEAWLFEAGALTVTLHDARDDDDIEHAILEPAPGEVRLWDSLTVVGLFAQDTDDAAVAAALTHAATAQGLTLPEYRLTRLADQVWERAWMDAFQPMRFGDRLWICPTHREVVDASAISIRLDPGLAFGSGTHATTAQCLEWLGRDTARTLEPFAGCHVVDYGCGSGVLAIAAALLGAETVIAVDIDPQALEATARNAQANGVQGRVIIGQPSILVEQVDIVLANILMGPLEKLAGTFASKVLPGGRLILSGLLESQSEVLRLRYNPWFEFAPGKSRDGWALLQATRRSNA